MSETKLLTPEQTLFTRAYTRQDTDTFSNATLSYAEAYSYDFASLDTKREIDENGKEIQATSERDKAYNYCKMAGSRLMTLDNIRSEIKKLMLVIFNDDDSIDKRLVEVILQGKDADSINAIKHRNDLKQRITKKLDVTTMGRPFASMTDEELMRDLGE